MEEFIDNDSLHYANFNNDDIEPKIKNIQNLYLKEINIKIYKIS